MGPTAALMTNFSVAAASLRIVDLSEITFLDSTGLTVILRAMQEAQENGWHFGIASDLSPDALRTVRVAGALPMLPLVDYSWPAHADAEPVGDPARLQPPPAGAREVHPVGPSSCDGASPRRPSSVNTSGPVSVACPVPAMTIRPESRTAIAESTSERGRPGNVVRADA
jgi:anti-anti-sigma factor